MADHAWSGLKPSGARVLEAGNRRPGDQNHHQCSLRGTDLWKRNASSDESWGVGTAPGHGPPSTGLQTPAPGAMKRLVSERAGAGLGTMPGLQHHRGSKRFLSPKWDGSDQQRLFYRFDSSPCSESKLDEEMAMFESQITRTVSDHFSNLTSQKSSLSLPLVKESSPVVADAAASKSAEKSKSSEFTGTSSDQLKRILPDCDVQGDHGWIHPLKLLVRKELTLSDVGELGRIIIPKKDAESQSFPQIDTKEGTGLEMEDYSASKRWYFRYKYWVNNKSRMYVLENTGEFIKYHSLKEHDMFVIYEDGCKKLVVCGQKKSRSENFDPLLKRSASETLPPPPPPPKISSRTSNIDNNAARS